MGFSLTREQEKRYNEWKIKHDRVCPLKGNEGAIGGRITFCFTGTSLGQIVNVKCGCGEEICLNDFEDW